MTAYFQKSVLIGISEAISSRKRGVTHYLFAVEDLARLTNRVIISTHASQSLMLVS